MVLPYSTDICCASPFVGFIIIIFSISILLLFNCLGEDSSHPHYCRDGHNPLQPERVAFWRRDGWPHGGLPTRGGSAAHRRRVIGLAIDEDTQVMIFLSTSGWGPFLLSLLCV